MNYYTETVLIDEVELPKEKVLFMDESEDVNISDYKKRGYNYTRIIDDRERFSVDFLKKLLKLLPKWFKSLFSLLPKLQVLRFAGIISDYIRCSLKFPRLKTAPL